MCGPIRLPTPKAAKTAAFTKDRLLWPAKLDAVRVQLNRLVTPKMNCSQVQPSRAHLLCSLRVMKRMPNRPATLGMLAAMEIQMIESGNLVAM
jgi:hypothetical protein